MTWATACQIMTFKCQVQKVEMMDYMFRREKKKLLIWFICYPCYLKLIHNSHLWKVWTFCTHFKSFKLLNYIKLQLIERLASLSVHLILISHFYQKPYHTDDCSSSIDLGRLHWAEFPLLLANSKIKEWVRLLIPLTQCLLSCWARVWS